MSKQIKRELFYVEGAEETVEVFCLLSSLITLGVDFLSTPFQSQDKNLPLLIIVIGDKSVKWKGLDEIRRYVTSYPDSENGIVTPRFEVEDNSVN